MRDESIGERKHADKLIERILSKPSARARRRNAMRSLRDGATRVLCDARAAQRRGVVPIVPALTSEQIA